MEGSPFERAGRSVARLVCLVMFAAAACGGDGLGLVAEPPATIEQLTGQWRPIPLVLGPDMRARLEQTCRRDMERMPGSRAGVIDVRGAGVAVIRMVGESAGTCDAIQITDAGGAAGAGGGGRTDGIEVLPPLDPLALEIEQVATVEGGNLEVTGFSVIGRAGSQIASVTVEPPGLSPIVATLENGWFAAWWPAHLPPLRPGGAPPVMPMVTVRGYDASGVEVVKKIR